MLTLDQWKLHLMTGGAVGERPKLGQTAAENILRHVLEFPPLLHGPHLHGAQEILGYI